MLNLLSRTKKTTLLSVVILNLATINTSNAQELAPPPDECKGSGTLTEQYLFCIKQHTHNILNSVNKLPEYITAAGQFITSWMTTDETDKSIIPEMQAKFTTLTNDTTEIEDTEDSLQAKIVTDFFKDPADISLKTPLTAKQLPNANDLSYQTLLGIPYFKKDPRPEGDAPIDSALNYTKIASGLNILHPVPNIAWQGSMEQRQRYSNYYFTLSAVQTYNAYLMSELYAEYKNKNKLTETQTKLIEQASSSDWLTQIASDNLGLVLRHILMFDSQIFVLLTRILEVEKQILMTQAMNNSLLMVLNLGNEDTLIKKANGEIK